MKRLVVLTWVIFFLVACQQTGPTQNLEAQREWVWWRGVSLAGAEFAVDSFGQGALPGTYGVDYIYPLQTEVNYFKAKGMNVIRIPFRWERLQHTLYGKLDLAELAA